jgi:hypothetical protein
MAPSVFLDRASPPTDDDLAAALGRSFDRWRELVDTCAERFSPLDRRWSHPGPNFGWSLRLGRKKRSIVYLIPRRKHFAAATPLGEKAAAVALADEGLPADVKDAIENAERYPEGRAFRRKVRTKADVAVVMRVLEDKMGV